MSKNSSSVRTRNYASVVYPESAPDNWREILDEHRVPAFISPLHDLDVNPDGEIKKAHYHVMLCFEGPKTVEQASSIFNDIGGVGCEIVNSLRGYARYLCHLDNPEKHQYPPEDVICVCGADYYAAVNLPTDKYKALREMMDFCRQNHIEAFSELADYASMNRMDWFRILCDSGSVFMKEYLKSFSWSMLNSRRAAAAEDRASSEVPQNQDFRDIT